MQTALSGDLWRRIGAITGAVAIALLAFWLARHIPRTISIFVIAAFIAFGVQPIAVRLERRMPKPLAISIVFFALLLLIAVFLVIVVPLTVSQMQLLATNVPSYATTAQSWLVSRGHLAPAALSDAEVSRRQKSTSERSAHPNFQR